MDEILDTLPVFAELPEDERRFLAGHLIPREYRAGELLFRENDPGDHLLIILEGDVVIFKALGTPDELILAHRSAGHFVGELSMLQPDGRRAASVLVRRDLRALELSHAVFRDLLRRQPGLAYEMLRLVSERLRDANNTAIRDMRAKNRHLARALNDLQRAQERLIAQERLAHEMQLAREIQESMLPTVLPASPEFDIGARIVPAREVGGDFYDVFLVDLDTIGVVVGDVCGKGVPAALYTAQVRSLIRAETVRGGGPEATLRRVNALLQSLSTAEGMFVTVVYGLLSRSTREFVAVRAGHEPIIGWDSRHERIAIRHGLGHPLGILTHPALDVVRITLAPGTTLLVYTDGVTEAASPGGELYGRDRLAADIAAMAPGDAQSLCDRLIAVLEAFRATADQADDITMIAIHARA